MKRQKIIFIGICIIYLNFSHSRSDLHFENHSLISKRSSTEFKMLQGIKLLLIKGGTLTMGSPESDPMDGMSKI